ncbi:M14 family metallopeptidase [Gemmatimonadota bacterium]
MSNLRLAVSLAMRTGPRLVTLLLLTSLISVPGPSAAQDQLLTVAEASGFKATALHADVMEFVTELKRLSPLVRLETLATSAEGRAVPLIVIGDPVPASPKDLAFDDRAVVYIQANIHAGEVEGKEAAMMLARDIVTGKTARYLDKLVLLIAPIFNADGNDKIDTRNRTNQVGPEGGVGTRYNGQNLDLNRDGMKLESPEAVGLVRNALIRWDPVFFLDSHTHNGSYHQEPVTWTWGLNPNGDPGILTYMADVLLEDITRRMRDDYGILTVPHGDFRNIDDPEVTWVPLGPQPRYLSNYVGLRNRLSILNEQYPYVDFETRVKGAYSLFLSFLDHLHENKDQVVELIRDADRRTVAKGMDPADAEFIVEYEAEAIGPRITVQGYEMEMVDMGGGRMRPRPTEVKRTYADIPYMARFVSSRSVSFPAGYLITVQDRGVIDKLLQHGVAVERLTEPATLTVESFTVSEVAGAPRLNQGHYTTNVTGEYQTGERDFPAGTYLVTTAQALGSVAAYLLEPESDDGLVVWNYFDRYLATQWSQAAQPYPVFKLLSPVTLVTERVGG